MREIKRSNGDFQAGHVDLLLAVDCVYYREAVGPLLKTIRRIGAERTLVAMERRDIGTDNPILCLSLVSSF